MSGQLQEHTAGDREFQILGDAIEKLQAPNDVCADGMVSKLVLDDLRNKWECERKCKYNKYKICSAHIILPSVYLRKVVPCSNTYLIPVSWQSARR